MDDDILKGKVRKRKYVLFSILGLFLLIVTAYFALAANSEGPDWQMTGKNLNRTSWDGVAVVNVGVVNTSRALAFPTGEHQQPHVVNGRVYVSEQGGFSRYDASDVTILIDSFRDPVAPGTLGNAPIVANGYVYFTNNRLVYQLYESNLSVVATHAVGGALFTASTMVMALWNGNLYIGSGTNAGVGYFYQLSAANVANQISIYTINNEVDFDPAIANGYAFFGGRNNVFYQVNANNVGSLVASYTTGGQIANWGATVCNGYVYVGSFDGYLYQFPDNNVGSYYRRLNTGMPRVFTPVCYNGYIYVASAPSISGSGTLWQVNASDVSIVYNTFSLPSASNSGLRSPSVSDGVVYVPVRNFIYELDADNITLSLRNISTSGGIPSGVALTPQYEYFFTDTGVLYQYARAFPAPACVENWTASYVPPVCDGIVPNRTLLYTDQNMCGTTNNLPLDNGTVSSCCVESWSVQYQPPTCINGTQLKYYVDIHSCNTTAALPLDNGTAIQCQGPTGTGGSFPTEPVVPIVEPTPIFVVVPPGEEATTFNFKGLYEQISILMEKLFTGNIAFEEVSATVGAYGLELLITVIALALIILAGVQFTKKNKRGKR